MSLSDLVPPSSSSFTLPFSPHRMLCNHVPTGFFLLLNMSLFCLSNWGASSSFSLLRLEQWPSRGSFPDCPGMGKHGWHSTLYYCSSYISFLLQTVLLQFVATYLFKIFVCLPPVFPSRLSSARAGPGWFVVTSPAQSALVVWLIDIHWPRNEWMNVYLSSHEENSGVCPFSSALWGSSVFPWFISATREVSFVASLSVWLVISWLQGGGSCKACLVLGYPFILILSQ